MVGMDSFPWFKIIFIFVLIGFIFITFNFVLRKALKVERKRFFSYNHVNQRHKKIDWTIRIVFIVVLIIGYVYNVNQAPMERIWQLEPWFLLFVFIIISEVFQAFMEWKYATNRKAYILTISELVIIILVVGSVYITNFFGIFS